MGFQTNNIESITTFGRIILADPNRLIAEPGWEGLPNAMPEQDMRPYVELRAIRHRGGELHINPETGGWEVENQRTDIINLLGFDTESGTYTSAYAEDLGDEKRDNLEGFGIRSLEIKLGANYIPDVSIEFVDVRGTALFAKAEDSPLSAIFDYPPPQFQLRIKGAFGMYVTYHLQLVSATPGLLPGRSFSVKTRFIGSFYGPLTDVLIGHLMQVPHMRNEPVNQLASGDAVKNLPELVSRGQILSKRVESIRTGSGPTLEFAQIKTIIEQVDKLGNYLKEPSTNFVDAFREFCVSKNDPQLGNADDIKVENNSSRGIGELTFTFPTDLTPVKLKSYEAAIQGYITLFRTQLNDEYGVLGAGTLHKKESNVLTSDKLISVSGVKATDGLSRTVVVKYEKWREELQTYKTDLIRSQTAARVQAQEDVAKVSNEQLGQPPTIGNIFSVICTGVDQFLDLIREAGNKGQDSKRKLPSQAGLAVPPELTNVQTESLGGFPALWERPRPRVGGQNVTQREVLVYPGKFPECATWPEVKLVEDYCRAIEKSQQQLRQLESLLKQVDATQYLPISPAETVARGTDGLQAIKSEFTNAYLKSQKTAEALRIATLRYLALRHHVYGLRFTLTNPLYDTIPLAKVAMFGTDTSRRQLIRDLAKAEATNLVWVVQANDGLSKLFLDIFGGHGSPAQVLFSQIDSLKGTLTGEEATLLLDKGAKTSRLPIGVGANEVYPNNELLDRRNPNFRGLLGVITDPQAARELFTARPDHAPSSEDEFEFTNYDNYSKLLDDWFGPDKAKSELSITNSIVFIDEESQKTKGGSDFINNPQLNGDTLGDVIYNKWLRETLLLDGSNGAAFQRKLTRKDFLSSLSDGNGLERFYEEKDDLVGVATDLVRRFSVPGVVTMPRLMLHCILYELQLKLGYEDEDPDSLLTADGITRYLSKGDLKILLDAAALDDWGQLPTAYNLAKEEIDKLTPNNVTIKQERTAANEYFNEEGDDFLHKLLKPIYLVNGSTLTFLSPEQISSSVTNGFTSLRQANGQLDEAGELYWITFQQEVRRQLSEGVKKANEEAFILRAKLNDNDLKLAFYNSFKDLYERWIVGRNRQEAGFWIPGTENAVPMTGSPASTTLNGSIYSRFSFVSRSYEDIANKCQLDIQPIIDSVRNPEMSVYSAIGTLLQENNFMFFPLHSYMDFTAGKDGRDHWERAFKIQNIQNNDTIARPHFICMYMGAFSSRLATGSTTYPDDGFTFDLANVPADFNEPGPNVYAFRVRFSSQNQTMFADIDVSSEEFKNSDVSLKLADDIINKAADSNAPTKSQNLLNIYRNRSYSVTVDVPMGNMCIQPTQYFQLEGVPLFDGAYLIYEVSHRMQAGDNRLHTQFKGYRLGRYVLPIVTDPLMDILGLGDGALGDLTQEEQELPGYSKPFTQVTGELLGESIIRAFYPSLAEQAITKIKDIAIKLQIADPSWLTAIMIRESGLKTKAINTSSQAIGLIQFMPSTYKQDWFQRTFNAFMGESGPVTAERLLNCGILAQIEMVYQFYLRAPGERKVKNGFYTTFQRVCMAPFLPKFADKPSDFVCGDSNSTDKNLRAYYNGNKGFDIQKKGFFTIADVVMATFKGVDGQLRAKPGTAATRLGGIG